MKKINIAICIILIAGVIMPLSSIQAADNGVDDLRGRWDVEAFLFNPQDETEDPLPPVILYVNEMRASVVLADTFYAGGCMRSPETNAFMPLSIRAVYHAATNSYDVVIYSTYVPPEGEPFVMRLKGVVEVRGEGVKDDSGGGELVTEFATGEWSAIHHDRRVTKCPSVQDIGLGAQGDVYAHQDLGYASPKYSTLYETHTIIVSSGMLVETPDGSSTIVQEYTDLFSPDVDFVGRFRYLTHFEGQPVSGGIYKFTLLDVFGDPIPGTESTDIWTGCSQTAPTNFNASYDPAVSVALDWDDAADVPGEFEPMGEPQIGFYQIGVNPFNWEGQNDFGANDIRSSNHLIPWDPFEPGAAGSPDGTNFGVSLSELEDGAYLMDVSAFAVPNPQNGGIGLECAVYDSSERLVMVKQGGDLNLQDIATISGRTVDEDGEPIAGIEVNACEYDWHDGDFCGGDRTDENGDYTIGVIPGSYRVSVYGQAGWANQFYENTTDWGLATEVFANAGQDTHDVNFVLLHGGSISGFVFDADGIPQANIAVDTELGGYGTCTDENGYYILQGVPFGTYNIVAGRDFCGAHPFEEQTIHDVQVGSTDVNFFLNLAEQGYSPTLHVVPAHPEIHGHGWNPEAVVTIYVDGDDDLVNGYLYTESKLVTAEPTWCIEPCFDLNGVPELPNGILPGYVVTMTDGAATRIVHTTNLVWTGADPETDTVFGTADPYAWVEVTAHGPVWGQRMVQADENGNWTAYFSVPGTEDFEQDILDLEPGYHGRSIEFEGGVPDDGTLAYWHIEAPPFTIIAHPDHEWIFSVGWMVDSEITMYVDNNADPNDGYLLMMTQNAAPDASDPTVGTVWFSDWAPFDLAPTMYVIVTDGSITETLQVEALSIDQFDENTDTVTGTAPAFREVGVGVHQPDGDFWMVVTSGPDGNWIAPFASQGVDMLDVFDIHAILWDGDNDATQANYNFP